MKRINAIVTVYYPTSQTVVNITKIASQADRIFICDNSPEENRELFVGIANAFYVFFNENLGISGAMNKVLKDSSYQWNQEDYIIFFDQDSVIGEKHIKRLADEFESLLQHGFNVGCLGPVFFNNSNMRKEIPKIKKKISDVSMKVGSIMTSSMLCRYKDIEEIGFWNEKVFLDLADWDICWRLQEKNKVCVMTSAVVLNHTIGRGEKKIGPIHLRVGQPSREYYQTRDCLYLLHKKYTPLKYKVRFLSMVTIRPVLHMLFLDDKKERIYYVKKGIEDYRRRIKGAIKT